MLIQLLNSFHPAITPSNTKVHLAQHNGKVHPIDVYLEGGFDKWQSWQTRKNFECRYLIGLVEIPKTRKWLLAGVYDSLKVGRKIAVSDGHDYIYDYRRLPEFAELEGRLIIRYKKPRANYVYLKTCLPSMTVSSA